ncbi:MAG TPA: lytic murein transglycosylase B [Burkholderiaceae bacterium]|nr:lytic murein transglycosylase B [Burkholderiaceae bacterium]
MRVIQLSVLLVSASLLAGCASRTTATEPTNQVRPVRSAETDKDAPGKSDASTPSATGADATAAGYLPAGPAPDALPTIQAGQSQAMASEWVDDQGRLKPDVQAYATELAETRNIPQDTVEQLLKSARYNAQAAKLMSPAKTRVRRSWVTYRKRFVEPVRLKAGLEFWQQHASLLKQAEQTYGVPASIIVSIIGVETIFGRYTGDFRTLDALATLGFRYPDPTRPERSRMFRNQLADLITLHHEGKLNAYEAKGSYAGAMGLPQFMPGSLQRFAVDGDGDGRIDLENSVADAVFSIASYLRHHGWVPGLPVFAPVILSEQAKRLQTRGLEPNLEWPQLLERQALARPDGTPAIWQQHALGMVDLVDEPRKTVEYRVGTPNFFAITHYNHSYFYAASVADLAQNLAYERSKDNRVLTYR